MVAKTKNNDNYKEKIQCTSCGKEKRLTDFYSSYSPIHKYHGKYSVCKECVVSMVDPDSVRSVKNMLRMLDKPYLESLYQSSVEEADSSGKGSSAFRIYMKNVVMRQYRDMTWEDSSFNEEHQDIPVSRNVEDEGSSEFIPNDVSLTSDVRGRWHGWKEDQIKKLESKYQELINSYEHDTPIQKNIYKNIAVAQLQADEAIAGGKSNDYKRYMDVIRDLMNDAKIKPLQETASKDGSLSTWGEWVAKIEEDEPIPEPSDEFKDVDGIRDYISKWFVGHMKRMLGIEDNVKGDKDA